MLWGGGQTGGVCRYVLCWGGGVEPLGRKLKVSVVLGKLSVLVQGGVYDAMGFSLCRSHTAVQTGM